MATTAPARSNLITRFPLAAFFALAIALGGGVVWLVTQGLLPAGMTVGAAISASLAGVLMTALVDGRAGLKQLFRQLRIRQVSAGYWVFAFLYLVPAVLLGALANPLFNGDRLALGNFQPAFAIVPMYILFFFIAGLGQELGWTGFLIPRLQSRYSALTAAVMRAVLVGIWNLPLLLYSRLDPQAFPSIPYGSWIAQIGFPAALAVMLVMFLLPWSIFFTWMYNNTGGNLLLVAILHGSEIWLPYWMLSTGVNPDNINNYWGYGTVLLLTALLIVVITGRENLSRRERRVGSQPQGTH